jgi:nitrogen fixation protein NifZ
MLPRYEYGAQVRVIRNLRNDGTYPGKQTGELLIRRGSLGYVRDVGSFLQDQIIYSVHFLEQNLIIGCREEELIGGEEDWIPTRFEFREKVRAGLDLGAQGQVLVEKGSQGQVIKVLREEPPHYHVLFGERVLQVPESALEAAEEQP